MVNATLKFKQLTAGLGSDHTCGLTTDNQAYCWGRNNNKQLGDNSSTLKFKQLTTGQLHTCGLTTDNKAYCWGNNYFGQLGDNTSINRSTPTLVYNDPTFKQLTAGAGHTCGLTTDNQVYCWGSNAYGQLGNEHIGIFYHYATPSIEESGRTL